MGQETFTTGALPKRRSHLRSTGFSQTWDASALSLALGSNGICSPDGWARGQCPEHNGSNPSLAIRLLPGGRLAAKCFSHNCAPSAIRAAIDGRLGTKFSCDEPGIVELGPKPAFLAAGFSADLGAAGGGAEPVTSQESTAVQDTPTTPYVHAPWHFSNVVTATAQNRAKDPKKVRERLNRIMQGTTPGTPDSLFIRYLAETRGLTLSVIPKTHKRQGSRRHGPARFAQLCPNEHDRPDRRLGVADPVQPAVREVVA